MSAGFEPSMIGDVVRVTTVNAKSTETRTVVGRLLGFCDYERVGELPMKMGWFQVEGEPDSRVAFDESHSSQVEAFEQSAVDQQAMIADELQQLRTALCNGDLWIRQLAVDA